MRQFALRTALVTTLLASALPLSNHAHALFSIDEATKAEQLVQIGIAEETLKGLLQQLEKFVIGAEIAKAIQQMMGVANIVEAAMEYEVPEKFVREYDVLTPAAYNALAKENEAFMAELDADIDRLAGEVALNEDRLATITMALNLAGEPPSDIAAQQAAIIGDASRLEQQQRETALRLLKDRREDLRRQMEQGNERALRAALRCVDTGKCK